MTTEKDFITILGRTTKEIIVPEGIITIRNCGPAKIFVAVGFEENEIVIDEGD